MEGADEPGDALKRQLAAILAVVTAGAATLWYLTAPPKGADGYRERAAASAETIHSQVQLARIWVESVEDDESTRAAALVGLEETETDALGAATSFEGYEPPSGLNVLRSRFTALASDATDALASLRIAAQQEEWEEVIRASEDLPGLAERLIDFEEDAEP